MDIKTAKLELIARLTVIEDETLILRVKQLLDQASDYGLFETTDEDLIERAKSSLKSISQGRTRNITEFENEVKAWKTKQSIG